MTELMVVIGVIAVLAGILLTAMRGVRIKALETQTTSTMQQLAQACEAFQLEHSRYPGAFPERALAEAAASNGDIAPISGTENAVLELMGGACIKTPAQASQTLDDVCPNFGSGVGTPDNVSLGNTDWEMRFDINLVGNGPEINGTPYAPYFTPDARNVVQTPGQVGFSTPVDRQIPEVVDAWGQPIIYLRRARSTGPLVGGFATSGSSPAPQFYAAAMTPYTQSEGLGEAQRNQKTLSILNTSTADQYATLAQMMRHPGMGGTGSALQILNNATPRGAFCLFSAGPDGIYFAVQDGPGSTSAPIDNIIDNSDTEYNDPKVVEDYDDIRIFGGG